MSRFVVKSPLSHNNKIYEIGETLELDPKEAAPLLTVNVVEAFTAKKEEDEIPPTPSEDGQENEDEGSDQETGEKTGKNASKKDKGKGK